MMISCPAPKLFQLTSRLVALLASGVCFLSSILGATTGATPAVAPLLLECEDMEFKAGWTEAFDKPGASGGVFLWSPASKSDAFTVIEVPHGGHYDVWSRTWDFAQIEPGTRRYLVLINGEPMERESGQHKTQGFAWEKVGSVELASGRHVVGLRDSAQYWSRPDAILLAPPGFDPTTKELAELRPYRVKPVPVQQSSASSGKSETDESQWAEARELVAIESAVARMAFVQASSSPSRIGRKLALREGNRWVPAPFNPDEEALFVIFSPDPKLDTTNFIPSWSPATPIRITVGGRDYEIRDSANPFTAGQIIRLRAIAVKKLSASQIAVDYAGSELDGGGKIAPAGKKTVVSATALWSLDGLHQRIKLTFRAHETGSYSVGFSPFRAWTRDQVEFVQLPPLFQMQRLPDYPVMLASATMPHPLALVQATPPGADTSHTWAVAADPEYLPFEWGRRRNSPYGFSILNAGHSVQGTAFSPVLGMDGSRVEAGRQVQATFVATCMRGDWKSGLAALSGSVFRVADYREPVDTSLTDAALNMIDLIKDSAASGWDAKLRGHYNIESENTITHASPLTALSVARLTQDPEFFADRALPTIEYTLSRQTFHHAPKPAIYVPAGGIPLTFPGRAFGPRYWQGVHELTGRQNTWIGSLVPSVEQLARQRGAPMVPLWAQMLADYQLAPSAEKRVIIEEACEHWINTAFYGRHHTRPLGVMPFYNFSFYPYWWDLLDLYEITGKRQFLDAAVEGGFHTIAGLWSHPRAPSGDVTIHPGGRHVGSTGNHTFWKGTEKHRLGFPRQPGDSPERRVPAWKVSRVGLGIEQPITLYQDQDDNGMRNILNNAWAPSLLRLSAHSGRDIFKTYARNTIIGRFGNYPGYYVNGFTDIHMSPNYPYQGPDVSDIYYHHIPVHLAFTLDYLFAEAETLSNGAIRFPYVRQQDYVWFTSRQYGHAPGSVYGADGLWPWLDRKAFSVDSPQVNYLGALGNGKFDVIVTNSSHREARATLRLDRLRTGVAAGAIWQFLVNGETTAEGRLAPSADSTVGLPFTLPLGAVGVFRFPSEKQSLFETIKNKPLDAKPVQLNLPSPWGRLHAIRIRSPFGTDSLYVYATQMAPAGSIMRLRFLDENGASAHPVQEVRTAPFEITVDPFPIQKTARFVVELTSPKGDIFVSAPVELTGTP